MSTEPALSMDTLTFGRPVDGVDARDRRIIGSVVRALQRLLESDGVTPALREDQRAQVVVRDGKVMLLAAVSMQAIAETNAALEDEDVRDVRPPRLPPLQARAPRTFVFG